MSLESQQKRILKRLAGPLFPDPTPKWTDIGDDTRKEILKELLARLRASQNTGIADIIEGNPDLGWACLQEKVRSLRWTQKKKSIASYHTRTICAGGKRLIHRRENWRPASFHSLRIALSFSTARKMSLISVTKCFVFAARLTIKSMMNLAGLPPEHLGRS
ncbi:hypothetical protein J7T55_012018 [Diaporthe amygdali]|uniref:uncharacterized protein n=1 Tax=Phomopsis amygdali TaxID=1214568 RepID=UPI0022FE2EF7|nr:uncharacterized protein J7T55_012018 [Diaporthe amygdali]KAJ0123553.1 hypothetical protein J7T55_012018 [Diaporthe amygdali]